MVRRRGCSTSRRIHGETTKLLEEKPDAAILFRQLKLWAKDGAMLLKLGGELVARAGAPGNLSAQPGDSVQVGVDLIKPVGDYAVPNRFRGTISNLRLDCQR